MDILFIQDLKVSTTIGVYAWERQLKQTLILDLELGVDILAAAKNDDLEKAVDYSMLCERVQSYLGDQSFQLLETLAENTAQFLLQEYQLPWIKLKVSKHGCVPKAKCVGLVVERSTPHSVRHQPE
jgi:dihydroneopterin aldolase